MTRALARAGAVLAVALACCALFAAWLAPGNVLAWWTLAAFCH